MVALRIFLECNAIRRPRKVGGVVQSQPTGLRTRGLLV